MVAWTVRRAYPPINDTGEDENMYVQIMVLSGGNDWGEGGSRGRGEHKS